MKKILVFGATGNIGAYLVDYLNTNLSASDYEVIAIGRKKTTFFERIGVQYLRVDVKNPPVPQAKSATFSPSCGLII